MYTTKNIKGEFMSYDLSGVKASNGKPKGKFVLRILSAKVKPSRKGEDMLSLEMSITGDEFEKFKVFETFMLQGNGATVSLPKIAYLMDLLEVERNLDNMTPWLNKLIEADLKQDENGYTKVNEYFKYEQPADEF